MDFRVAIAAMLLAAACSGNPIGQSDDGGGDGGGGDDGGGDPTALIPETISKDMRSADLAGWSSSDSTIRIRMTAQDATDLNALYTRDAALDTAGYTAYSYQSTTSNRKVVALVGGVGDLKAVTAVDAGQFANYHGGAQLYRADSFVAPTSGVGQDFNYSGSYAGLLNWGPATSGGPGGGLNPTQSYRTSGRALITADFTEMQVSGGVDNRTIVDTGEDLPNIAFWSTGITANGTFTDKVQRVADGALVDAGTYAGAFGGINASEVAIVTVFNPTGGANAAEHGLITLPSCSSGGGPACP